MLNTDLKGEKDQEDGIIKRKSNLSFWVPIDPERVDGRARAAQRERERELPMEPSEACVNGQEARSK